RAGVLPAARLQGDQGVTHIKASIKSARLSSLPGGRGEPLAMSQVVAGFGFAEALLGASPNSPSFSPGFATYTQGFHDFSTTGPALRGSFAELSWSQLIPPRRSRP